ncbi:MAG: hypothetical protein WCR95_07815 [Eubacteriales bacterium]|jgi:flagellar hook-associated protein 3 FlgL
MRITNNMLTKNYLKSLNQSLGDLTEANTRIAVKRSYLKISENPTDALKAMKVRKNLSLIDIYTSNLKDAQDLVDQYETAISNINEILKEARAQVSQGVTGTSDVEVRKTVAGTLRSFQDAILAAVNTQFAGDYIFGGDSVGEIPFTISQSGRLLYKGQDADNGVFADEPRYLDIGIGLSLSAEGGIDPRSALDISNSGVALLGSGVDSDGIPENIYNLLGIIASKLETNDIDDIGLYSDKLKAKSDDIRLKYVSAGEKTNFISYFITRLESEKINAQNKQVKLESIDYSKSIVEFGDMELAYNACLQIGTKILQPSLLDFLR